MRELGLRCLEREADERFDAVALEQQPLIVRRDEQVRNRTRRVPFHGN